MSYTFPNTLKSQTQSEYAKYLHELINDQGLEFKKASIQLKILGPQDFPAGESSKVINVWVDGIDPDNADVTQRVRPIIETENEVSIGMVLACNGSLISDPNKLNEYAMSLDKAKKLYGNDINLSNVYQNAQKKGTFKALKVTKERLQDLRDTYQEFGFEQPKNKAYANIPTPWGSAMYIDVGGLLMQDTLVDGEDSIPTFYGIASTQQSLYSLVSKIQTVYSSMFTNPRATGRLAYEQAAAERAENAERDRGTLNLIG